MSLIPPKAQQVLRLLHPEQILALLRRRRHKIQRKLQDVEHRVLSFEPRPGVQIRGDVLVAYIIDAFLLKEGPEPIDVAKVPHTDRKSVV